MSLKQKLLDTLKANGRMDLNELQAICNAYPAKISTAEKRLREFRERLHPDYQPEVGVEIKNGYINAYVWKTQTDKMLTKNLSPFMQRWNEEFKKEEKQITENRLF